MILNINVIQKRIIPNISYYDTYKSGWNLLKKKWQVDEW